MRQTDAKELVESFAKHTDRLIEGLGQIPPTMFFHGREGQTILDLRDMFCGAAGEKHRRKDAGLSAIRDILKREDADWCLLVTEAWTVEVKGTDAKTLDEARKHIPDDLEHHPGRIEVVWLQFEDQDSGSMLCRRQINRGEDGKPHLGPIEWVDIGTQSEGRMVGLLPARGRAQ